MGEELEIAVLRDWMDLETTGIEAIEGITAVDEVGGDTVVGIVTGKRGLNIGVRAKVETELDTGSGVSEGIEIACSDVETSGVGIIEDIPSGTSELSST